MPGAFWNIAPGVSTLSGATTKVCAMSVQETGTADIKRAAYEIAWREFNRLPGLTPDRKNKRSDKLRWYIQVVVEIGEQDPSKIASLALGMIREYEQILRSKGQSCERADGCRLTFTKAKTFQLAAARRTRGPYGADFFSSAVSAVRRAQRQDALLVTPARAGFAPRASSGVSGATVCSVCKLGLPACEVIGAGKIDVEKSFRRRARRRINLAIHAHDDLPHNAEAEAGAGLMASIPGIGLREFFENPRLEVGRNTGAVVAHGDVSSVAPVFDRNGDFCPRR